MAKPDTLIVDGHAFSWRRLCELRRQQLEAWKAARGEQPALFELQEDFRPSTERTAAGRFHEPSLFAKIAGGCDGSRVKDFRKNRNLKWGLCDSA